MKQSKKIFLIVMFFSLVVRVYLFLDVGSILGADVGRYSTISHVMFLKGEITPNLQPYDMAEGFFYFPGTILLPIPFEYLGINPIATITFFSFLFSFLGIIVFYKIAKLFLTENQAVASTFFYSFIFDFVLIFTFYGVFPYGFASFFFLLTALYCSKFFFSKTSKRDYFLLFFGIFGIFAFHWYLFFPVLIFVLSLFVYEFVEHKNIKKTFKLGLFLLTCLVISFVIFSPYLNIFLPYKDISNRPDNTVDLLTFQATRIRYNVFEKIQTVFFMSYMGSFYSGILIASFILFLFCIKDFIKDKKIIWLYFLFFLAIHSLSIFYELNLLRISTFMWLVYALVLGYKFNKHYMLLVLIPFLFFIQSPSILNLIYTLNVHPEYYTPLVDFYNHGKAMTWIEENTPEDAIFLIDGGGSGCTGTSASHGERIFPLTSRMVFYFTDYCFASYNRTEFRKRVELYRRISINPSCCMDELKTYNITHVFIGEREIALESERFNNNQNYELVYNESDNKIFKII